MKTDKELEGWVKKAIEASEDFQETGALSGKNPKYSLEELLVQTTPEAVEYSRKVCHEWNMSKPIGNECYWEDDEEE